jgi:hypothetical protein
MGEIERFKARLVGTGFQQVKDIDYHEIFSPVSRFTSMRTLLALAAYHNMSVRQIDIKTAFLHGDLEEEVYMEQPQGFEKPNNDGPKLVCLLEKGLYGLKQANRIWGQALMAQLRAHGYTLLRSTTPAALPVQQRQAPTSSSLSTLMTLCTPATTRS